MARNPAQRDLYVGALSLIAIELLTALAAIALFVRMSPAIDRILQENVASIAAGQQMLTVLASPGSGDAAAFDVALAAARSNRTELREQEALETIETHGHAALSGDARARERVIAALGRLSQVNLEAMRRADREAQRLGAAGAWAMVLLGFGGVIAGVLVLRRLGRRLLWPIAELERVLAAAHQGDRYQRCQVNVARGRLREALSRLNAVLDEREPPRSVAEASLNERALLLHLLDERPQATVVLDPQGNILAANRAALELLSGAEGDRIREALHTPASGANEPIAGSDLSLHTLD